MTTTKNHAAAHLLIIVAHIKQLTRVYQTITNHKFILNTLCVQFFNLLLMSEVCGN